MSGLIQRLLDRSRTVPQFGIPIQPNQRSTSPLVEHDQRLQNLDFRDNAGGLPLGGSDFGGSEPGFTLDSFQPTIAPLGTPSAAPRLDNPQFQPQPSQPKLGDAQTPLLAPPLNWQQIPDPIAALRAQARDDSFSQPGLPPESTNTVPSPKFAPSVPSPQATSLMRSPPTGHSENNPMESPIEMSPLASGPEMFADAKPPAVQHPKPVTSIPAPNLDLLQPSVPAPPTEPLNQEEKSAQVTRQTETETAMIRPAAPRPEMHEAPQRTPVPTETYTAPRAIERTVEKIVEKQVSTQKTSKPSTVPSANSVSRIGQLPTRRRVHTVFGLRRG